MMFRELLASDRSALETMLRGTPGFREADVKTALELVDDRLEKGDGSDYLFIIASQGESVLGYACYGLIPLTLESFDLYWLVVAPDRRGKGVGTGLIKHVEQDVIRRGGRRIYADTSSADNYAEARAFYTAADFVEAARLPDFYRRNEDKLIYCRKLAQR